MKINFLIKTIILLSFLFMFEHCQTSSEKQNIRAYYYPVENFFDSKVYEYRAVNDSLAPFYWHFTTSTQDGDTVLTSQYFDHNYVLQQLTNEEMVRNGMVLNNFFLYEIDTIRKEQVQNEVSVEVDNVFPFEVSDSMGLFLYKVFWKDYFNPNLKYRLIRNKHFMGAATYTYKGQQLDCVRFLNRELLEIEEEGFQDLRYNGVELYAKGIGLVYFRKEIENNIVQEYELKEIHDGDFFVE
jgi:hypothetical protein